jgi:hypothetical protein
VCRRCPRPLRQRILRRLQLVGSRGSGITPLVAEAVALAVAVLRLAVAPFFLVVEVVVALDSARLQLVSARLAVSAVAVAERLEVEAVGLDSARRRPPLRLRQWLRPQRPKTRVHRTRIRNTS